MGTVFVGRPRRGRTVRLVAALALAIAAMDLARAPLDRLRARVLSVVALPLARGRDLSPTDGASSLARFAASSLYGAATPGPAVVVACEPSRHALVAAVPASESKDWAQGRAVTDDLGRLVGFVDRIDFGLARCRLLSDRGLAVAAETEGGGAGVGPVRFALVAAGSRGLRVRYASDLDGVPAGARVDTAPMPKGVPGGIEIGVSIAVNGGPVADSVAASADPALVARVGLAGPVESSGPVDPLRAFEPLSAEIVAAADASPFRRTLLLASARPLAPGALIEAAGAVVGRIVGSTGARVTRAATPEDPGFRVEAFLVAPDGGRPALRLGLRGGFGRSRLRVESVAGAPDGARRGGLLVTAPDDGTAAPGFLVGRLEPVPTVAAGDLVTVALEGIALARRGGAVTVHRLRGPAAAADEGAP